MFTHCMENFELKMKLVPRIEITMFGNFCFQMEFYPRYFSYNTFHREIHITVFRMDFLSSLMIFKYFRLSFVTISDILQFLVKEDLLLEHYKPWS